jgi:ubiquinone/menaquinone biosynthesis C-methylase UbiE
MTVILTNAMDKDYFRYLKEDQYADASNLNARAQLHERFRTNEEGLHVWIFHHILQQGGDRLLELGSGPGYLWEDNLSSVPGSWRVTLTDISMGMLNKLREVLPNLSSQFELLACDAQWLPFPSEMFDTVIANHMLYHLRSIDQGVSNIARVLLPEGILFASTNGADHMQEVRDLVHSLSDEIIFGSNDIRGSISNFFSRENGEEVLAQHFQEVDWVEFDDDLIVTEIEPLIRYILSFPGNAREVFGSEPMLAKLHHAIQERIDRDSAFLITKSAGLFIGRKS